MNTRLRAGIAGAVGAGLALGVSQLAHGIIQLIPSVMVALAQRIIELTPGSVATFTIDELGKSATAVLISVLTVLTLIIGALLANLSLRSPLAALGGVAVLAVVALLAAFSQPFMAPFSTVVAILISLVAGVTVAGILLDRSGVSSGGRPSERGSSPGPAVRSREAYSGEGVAVNRAGFLAFAGVAAVAGGAAAWAGNRLAGGGAADAASQPEPLGDVRGSGTTRGTTASRKTVAPPPDDASLDVEGMPSLVTPTKDFYLIDTAITSPRINKDDWKLNVTGAVENPIQITYDDLLSFPVKETYTTLSCVSNEVGGGLVSNGKWTGVPIKEVLAEAGVTQDKLNSKNEQLVGRSVDGFTTGFETKIALNRPDAILAFGLNGKELPRKHGYPVRLVVPGLYGYVSATKWLTEIELTSWDFDAYWINRGWAKRAPIKTQSRIDTVEPGASLSAGKVLVGGVAWAPTRGISKVEVSTDGGKSWNEAELAAELDENTWRQYAYYWDAKPGDYTLKVRATDGEGNTQTAEKASPIPSGATGYHTIQVTVK